MTFDFKTATCPLTYSLYYYFAGQYNAFNGAAPLHHSTDITRSGDPDSLRHYRENVSWCGFQDCGTQSHLNYDPRVIDDIC